MQLTIKNLLRELTADLHNHFLSTTLFEINAKLVKAAVFYGFPL